MLYFGHDINNPLNKITPKWAGNFHVLSRISTTIIAGSGSIFTIPAKSGTRATSTFQLDLDPDPEPGRYSNLESGSKMFQLDPDPYSYTGNHARFYLKIRFTYVRNFQLDPDPGPYSC